jgi:hypothetical protein
VLLQHKVYLNFLDVDREIFVQVLNHLNVEENHQLIEQLEILILLLYVLLKEQFLKTKNKKKYIEINKSLLA